MTSIILAHASWCQHCINFKPTWEKVKSWCKSKGINTQEYEDAELQMMQFNPTKNTAVIPLDIIEGYPTIIIKQDSGNLIKVKNRNYEHIIDLLGGNTLPNKSVYIQSGGSYIGKNLGRSDKTRVILSRAMTGQYGGLDSSYFKKKYLKYKKKYLEAKVSLS